MNKKTTDGEKLHTGAMEFMAYSGRLAKKGPVLNDLGCSLTKDCEEEHSKIAVGTIRAEIEAEVIYDMKGLVAAYAKIANALDLDDDFSASCIVLSEAIAMDEEKEDDD